MGQCRFLRMKYIIIILLGAFVGCATNSTEPKFEPLPPEKLYDLLHVTEQYAYKSVTIKDYIGEEENCEQTESL